MSQPPPLAFALPWLSCTRCGLHKDRSTVVLGRGNPHADVMIVGEAPGPDEDQIGVPFVGRSGKVLTDIIRKIGWSRKDLFIDNVVACFPHNLEEGNATIREPSIAEISACNDRIMETIYRVDPILIITLGVKALRGLTGIGDSLGKVRGEMFFAKVPGFYKYVSYPLIPTWHPAHLVRNPTHRVGSPLTEVWEDFKYAKKMVDLMKRLYENRGEW